MDEKDIIGKICIHCGAPYVLSAIDVEENICCYDPACECNLEKIIHDSDPKTDRVYTNHCWNCPATIDSRVCEKDPDPDNGYICKRCGESLKNLKKRYQ
jgi:hypothetical protein